MEQQLIKKSIKGDTESFGRLVTMHGRYVYNIAYKFMGNPDDASDMAQESMIKAFNAISKFKQNSKFTTWLYRITINVCKDEIKKRRPDLITMEELENLPSNADDDPLCIYERKELAALISGALDRLSIEHREVLVMRETLNYSYEQIATELSVPVGTVKSRINRAKMYIRDFLKEGMEDGQK